MEKRYELNDVAVFVLCNNFLLLMMLIAFMFVYYLITEKKL